MFKFLFFIFFLFVLLLFLMGFSIFRTIKKVFFGGNDPRRESRGHHAGSGRRSDRMYDQRPTEEKRKKKIFTKDDGEYVDYEEVI